MSADITAFIQIDDNSLPDEPPFTSDPSTWDLSGDLGLSGCKDYKFYAAISGVRNESGIEPLFSCRGLPNKTSKQIRDKIYAPNVGWLTLAEINQALQHMGIALASLDLSVQMVLRTMYCAEELFGRDRVRLVFQISD